MPDLTATQLAERLGVTKRRALPLLRTETIAGRQLVNGTWLADSDAVVRYEISASRGSGRMLDTATAWGLLWELSGLDAEWRGASTRARVRRRIRDSDASAIASAVSKRSRAHRFTAANAERASVGFIRTGRSAASVLDTDFIEDTRQVSGYVRAGTASDYAKSHFMVRTRRALRELVTDRLRGRDDARSCRRSGSRDEHRHPRTKHWTPGTRRNEAAMAGRTLTCSDSTRWV